jgi:glycosidase
MGCKPDPTLENHVDVYGTPFAGVPDAADAVIYEVNLRAFSGSGDLAGVTARLDHLEALGVNVIWLMPIHPQGEVNSVNSPYCVRDFEAVSPEYGTLADLRALTDAAHARGMAVLMDWVANHTSWDHPWLENEGWHTTDAGGNVVHPPGTNWLDVADLDYGNEAMRREMRGAMRYWIEQANVDGFRLDYADGVPADFWMEALGELRAMPGRKLLFLAEGDRNDHWDAGMDWMFGWDVYERLGTVFVEGGHAASLFATHLQENVGVPAGRRRLYYTTNHDMSAWEETPMQRLGSVEACLAASAATLFLGGTPLIYTGQEVGRVETVPFFSNTALDWDANADMLEAYRAMFQAYRALPAARRGTWAHHASADVLAVHRVHAGQEVLVLVNVRGGSRTWPVPEGLAGEWVDVLGGGELDLAGTPALPAYAYRVLARG